MVTDEIVADLDWYPTIAHFTGEEERIPPDRPIDGVDQSDFILGKKKSNREYVVTYVGDTVFAVKWRTMKIHFAAAEGTHSVIQTYTFPGLSVHHAGIFHHAEPIECRGFPRVFSLDYLFAGFPGRVQPNPDVLGLLEERFVDKQLSIGAHVIKVGSLGAECSPGNTQHHQ